MSEQNPFVHLHVHSEYSLLDGLSRIDDLVKRAAALNQPAIALTDHGAMYGVMPFYRTAKKAGIKPIVGIETYLAARRMTDKDSQRDRNRFHMLMLAQNQTGYLNLLQIASAAQLEGYYYKPRIDRAFMAEHSDGIIATTGCMAAEIPRAIGDGNSDLAHRLMGEYLDIFGRDRLYIEFQEHSIPELTAINKKLLEMAPRYGLENNFLATNDVHYTLASDADPHEVLLCIQTSSTVKNPKLTFSDKGYYLKSHAEMARLFGEIPGALENSLRIAGMCEISLDSEGYHLPEFDVPEGYTAHSYLRELCENGLAWRYGATRAKTDEKLRARLERELGIINRMGFDTYFLIVWDLCEWAVRSDAWWEKYQDPYPYGSYSEWKEHDIWWNVRGSGAGSVVAYTLGITSIDPLANGLIFERFLNPGRVSMPDIDLDYPDDARHLMVAYTKRRYGEEKVAQIITFGTLGARAAIRDVGRALDMPLPEVDAIARMVPAIPGKPAKIENVLDSKHEFFSAELADRYKRENGVKELLDTAKNLEGISRHASSHAAGVIVSDRPLHEYLPLNRPTSGEEGLGGVDRVTQWPMEVVESIGLLKVDFLGLSTLTVMRRAARLIVERYATSYTMNNIPYDVGQVGPDPEKKPEALFDMLGRGEVAGIFQVEGAGMRRLMMEMKPRRFDHIIAAISLYRPGPMENIPEYIRRMHAHIFRGEDVVEYHTPELEPILGDTYGILVYQEQIIRIAAELAGYEPGEADMIRKAVSKKKKKLMEEHRIKFTEGAMSNGFSREVCEAIWADIEFFARYGFNKCLPGDTEVIDAATGRPVRIEDLYHGKATLSQTFSCDVDKLKLQAGSVVDVLDNGVKPVYRLTTSLGKQIEATANHPFYTMSGWRWLGKLEVGDQIGLPRSLPVPGSAVWPEHEVIALGHLLAEGNLCHPHSVYYYTQHEASLSDYVQAAEQFENVACTVATHRNTYSVYARRMNRQKQPGIVTWARQLGIWGKTASEKTLPKEAFTLKSNQLALLLGRLWDGDGSLRQQTSNSVHAYYATASERLARQLQHLLLRLGVMSSFRVQNFNYRDGRIGYQVHVMGGEHMVHFARIIGPHLLRADQKAICQNLLARTNIATASHDTIPLPIKTLVRREKALSGATWVQINQDTGVAQREFYPTHAPTKKGFRRQTIGRLAAFSDSDELRRYAESDIYWDEVVSIEFVGEKQTYDLTIAETHNFIANDILVHNSHAADYAKVTCQTAYLKAHYPVEYLAAMLSVERDNTDKVRRYFQEAKNLGIDIAPPDINRSGLDFTIEDEGERPLIRFGLGAIKNAGAAALSLIIEEREANGPYTTVQDLCDRVDLHRVGKRALEYMLKARVCDQWGTPVQMLDALDRIVGYSGQTHKAAAAGQMSLFGAGGAAPVQMEVAFLKSEDELEEVAHKDILEWEKEALGVHVSEHPLERPLRLLASHTNTTIGEITPEWNGRQVKLAGVLSQLRTLTTKKGDPMAFGTLEDLNDKIDVVFFPRTWKQCREEAAVDQVMLLHGKVQDKQGNDLSIIADKIQVNVELAQDADWNGDEAGADVPPPSWEMDRPAPQGSPVQIKKGGPPPPPAYAGAAYSTETGGSAPPPPPDDDFFWPPEAKPAPQQPGSQKQAKERLIFGEHGGNGNGHQKKIVVEIKPVGNWQQACRQSVKTAGAFEGSEMLRLRLAGQNLIMDFPNHHTQICDELIEKLERIPGVLRVYAS